MWFDFQSLAGYAVKFDIGSGPNVKEEWRTEWRISLKHSTIIDECKTSPVDSKGVLSSVV